MPKGIWKCFNLFCPPKEASRTNRSRPNHVQEKKFIVDLYFPGYAELVVNQYFKSKTNPCIFNQTVPSNLFTASRAPVSFLYTIELNGLASDTVSDAFKDIKRSDEHKILLMINKEAFNSSRTMQSMPENLKKYMHLYDRVIFLSQAEWNKLTNLSSKPEEAENPELFLHFSLHKIGVEKVEEVFYPLAATASGKEIYLMVVETSNHPTQTSAPVGKIDELTKEFILSICKWSEQLSLENIDAYFDLIPRSENARGNQL